MRGLNPSYLVEYLESVIHADIPSLNDEEKDKVKHAIEVKLRTDPMGYGNPLKYSLQGHRRLKVGQDLRVIYKIVPVEGKVLVTALRNIRPKSAMFGRVALSRAVRAASAAA